MNGRINEASGARVVSCQGGSLELGSRTLIMGILNITPDSFSDGGSYTDLSAAVIRAKQMIEEGADIIDIGGESTRPGAEKVSAAEEMRRILPVIEALKDEISIPISIDTYKAEVAKAALEAGAGIINDIWGLRLDREMAPLCAEYGCPVILMHNRSDMEYTDFIDDVRRDLLESISLARKAGIGEEKIILDPGIGFAKNYEHNLKLMNYLQDIVELGYPVLLGTSRKRFIRTALDLPAEEVVEGTLATNIYGITQGCSIVRVHDVKAMKRAAVMTDAMLKMR